MKARFLIAECSLSYAKIMQTRAMKARFLIAECSLSYAKVRIFLVLWRVNVKKRSLGARLFHLKTAWFFQKNIMLQQFDAKKKNGLR